MLRKDKGFIVGMVTAVGTWMIIMAARQDILINLPDVNNYMIGGALLFIAWLVTRWEK